MTEVALPTVPRLTADQMREYTSRRALLLDRTSATEILTYIVSEFEGDDWYAQAIQTIGNQEHINLDLLPDGVVARIYDIIVVREGQLRESTLAN